MGMDGCLNLLAHHPLGVLGWAGLTRLVNHLPKMWGVGFPGVARCLTRLGNNIPGVMLVGVSLGWSITCPEGEMGSLMGE